MDYSFSSGQRRQSPADYAKNFMSVLSNQHFGATSRWSRNPEFKALNEQRSPSEAVGMQNYLDDSDGYDPLDSKPTGIPVAETGGEGVAGPGEGGGMEGPPGEGVSVSGVESGIIGSQAMDIGLDAVMGLSSSIGKGTVMGMLSNMDPATALSLSAVNALSPVSIGMKGLNAVSGLAASSMNAEAIANALSDIMGLDPNSQEAIDAVNAAMSNESVAAAMAALIGDPTSSVNALNAPEVAAAIQGIQGSVSTAPSIMGIIGNLIGLNEDSPVSNAQANIGTAQDALEAAIGQAANLGLSPSDMGLGLGPEGNDSGFGSVGSPGESADAEGGNVGSGMADTGMSAEGQEGDDTGLGADSGFGSDSDSAGLGPAGNDSGFGSVGSPGESADSEGMGVGSGMGVGHGDTDGIGGSVGGQGADVGGSEGDGEGDGAGSGSVLCTELHRQGQTPDFMFKANNEFCKIYIDRETLTGYHWWGRPLARLMGRHWAWTVLFGWLPRYWTQEMAFRMGAVPNGSYIGKFIYWTFRPASKAIGHVIWWWRRRHATLRTV